MIGSDNLVLLEVADGLQKRRPASRTLNLLFSVPKLVVGLQIGPERGAIAKCRGQLNGQFRADPGPLIDDSGHIGPGHAKALCKLGNGQVALFHEQLVQDNPWMGGGQGSFQHNISSCLMIINIINIKNVTLVIPEDDPVIRADLNGPKPGIIARQAMNAAAKGFNIILRCNRIEGVQEQGNLR